MESHLLDEVDYIFALHNLPQLKTGQYSIRPGLQLMGSDQIEIDWIGESTHSSLVDEVKDAILAASTFSSNLQTIVSKTMVPNQYVSAIVTKFVSGNSHNIVSNYAQTTINLRYNQIKNRNRVLEKIENYAKNIGGILKFRVS